jgi:hypothetical protein
MEVQETHNLLVQVQFLIPLLAQWSNSVRCWPHKPEIAGSNPVCATMVNLLTQEEVRLLAREVGFGPKDARIASAIAMCEAPYAKDGKQYSNFDAVGDIDLQTDVWGPSYGGFQIRSLRADTGTGSFRDKDRLLKPKFNTKAALSIKKSLGFNAWSVYLHGQYKAYLQDLFPPAEGTYIVLAGDTLSGIGEKTGIMWTDLARWNNLHFPYTIFIGQVILLTDPTSV